MVKTTMFILHNLYCALARTTKSMGSGNKVHELATVCLLWRQWTETSVWFDDVGISAFHSCVVVDPWQSLSERRLLLSEMFWCAITRMSELDLEQRTLNF
jgi:hypothetical protein